MHPYHEIMLRPLLQREGRVHVDPARHDTGHVHDRPRTRRSSGIAFGALAVLLGLLVIMVLV